MSLNFQSNVAMPQNSVAFKGNVMQKCKTIAKNQAGHIITQGVCWAGLEAIRPSTSLMDVIIRKLCIDFGEVVGHKFGSKTATTVNNAGLNIFSYINLLKNQAKKLF